MRKKTPGYTIVQATDADAERKGTRNEEKRDIWEKRRAEHVLTGMK